MTWKPVWHWWSFLPPQSHNAIVESQSLFNFMFFNKGLTWLTSTYWMGDPIDPIDDGGTISWWFEQMQEAQALSSLFSLDAGHRVVVPGLQNRWQDGRMCTTYGSEQLAYCKKVSFSLHCWREGFQTSHCENYIQFPSWGGHMIFNFLIWCGFEKCMTLWVFCCCPKVHNFGANADIPSHRCQWWWSGIQFMMSFNIPIKGWLFYGFSSHAVPHHDYDWVSRIMMMRLRMLLQTIKNKTTKNPSRSKNLASHVVLLGRNAIWRDLEGTIQSRISKSIFWLLGWYP